MFGSMHQILNIPSGVGSCSLSNRGLCGAFQGSETFVFYNQTRTLKRDSTPDQDPLPQFHHFYT